MAQITWQNINAPNFGQGNALYDSGANRISDAISGLQTLATERNAINQQNYDVGVQRNTADLVNQLTQAGTISDLNKVDTKQFGAQVDDLLVSEALRTQRNTLQAAEMKEKELVLREREVNKLQFMNDGHGSVLSMSPITGRTRIVHTFPTGTKSSTGKDGVRGLDDLQRAIADQLQSDGRGIYDERQFTQWANDSMVEAGFTPAQVKKELAVMTENWQKFHSTEGKAKIELTAQTEFNEETKNLIEREIIANKNRINRSLVDTSIDTLGMQFGKTGIEEARKIIQIDDDSPNTVVNPTFGWKVNVEDIITDFSHVFGGRNPTGEELMYFANKVRSAKRGDNKTEFGQSYGEYLRAEIGRYNEQVTNKDFMDIYHAFATHSALLSTSASKHLTNVYNKLERDSRAAQHFELENRKGSLSGEGPYQYPIAKAVPIDTLTNPFSIEIESLVKKANDLPKAKEIVTSDKTTEEKRAGGMRPNPYVWGGNLASN